MAKKKSNGHAGFRNGKLFCFNCGQAFDIQLPQPARFAADLMLLFDKHHKHCEKTWKEPEPMMSWDEKTRADFWFNHGEQGTSSQTIYQIMTSKNIHGFILDHPYDPDDFRRCYGLLKMVPEWKGRIDEMRKVSPVWNRLVDHWDKLTEMFEASLKSKDQDASEMFELMQKIIKNDS